MSEFENCGGSCEGCTEECGGATITLTLDNDEVLECQILTLYHAAGKDYIALLPLNEQGVNEDGEVFLYRYHDENGMPVLENIESDEEYEAASDGFDEWLDGLEYDELVAEEDEDEPLSE
ncbi:MAG: DUF1292 domain-containing protein [Lachnospiraceae bacterium]|nr:DUF1292 domain-containing protein [Lachnospiraceae bacterium]